MTWFRKRTKDAPDPEPCKAHGIVIKDPVWRAQHATLDAVEARMRDEENPPTPDENAAMMHMLIAMGPIGGKRCHHIAPYPGCCSTWR